MAKKKIVLAYSGGLDTSVALKWLMDKGFDVVCYMADVGQGAEAESARKRAFKIGAAKCIVGDLRKEFITDYAFRALKAGALYQGKYNLATALSRPLIADAMVKVAKKEKAGTVAHGCTGKGNDQVRFEVTFKLKSPGLKIIAPVREWELTTREQEIDYAKKHKIPIEQTKEKVYSIDRNLWGISVEGGKLENPWNRRRKLIFLWLPRKRHRQRRNMWSSDSRRGYRLPLEVRSTIRSVWWKNLTVSEENTGSAGWI